MPIKKTEEKAETKHCPYCDNEIKAKAIKCQYCWEFLDKEESRLSEKYWVNIQPRTKNVAYFHLWNMSGIN